MKILVVQACADGILAKTRRARRLR